MTLATFAFSVCGNFVASAADRQCASEAMPDWLRRDREAMVKAAEEMSKTTGELVGAKESMDEATEGIKKVDGLDRAMGEALTQRDDARAEAAVKAALAKERKERAEREAYFSAVIGAGAA
ncbi:MAG: hypothetical protein HC915_17850, partial [Anaerolineae bacterium]|nr:hypothetical protein [Anaerolineae bacterium]